MDGAKTRPPITYDVKGQWGGITLERIRPNEMGMVEIVGFHSFEEGIPFFQMMNNFNEFANRTGTPPSMVDRMLVILEPKRSTVYVNDMLDLSLMVRAKRKIGAFQPVGMNDLAGIDRVQFQGVSIPSNAGVLMVLSHGWRKAFFFDLRPLSFPQHEVEKIDIEVVGAQLLTHLIYTEYFLLTDSEWDAVISAGWFPFMFLVGGHWDSLLSSICEGDDLEAEEAKIFESFASALDEKVDSWIGKEVLRDEEPFLRRAAMAFKDQDWLTLISLICPRIEGVIRRSVNSYGRHDKLVTDLEGAITNSLTHDRSLLFPKQLARYFRDTFFQFVDFSDGGETLNRHTVAHGTVPSESMNQSHALRLMLLVDHLYYCLPSETATHINEDSPDDSLDEAATVDNVSRTTSGRV